MGSVSNCSEACADPMHAINLMGRIENALFRWFLKRIRHRLCRFGMLFHCDYSGTSISNVQHNSCQNTGNVAPADGVIFSRCLGAVTRQGLRPDDTQATDFTDKNRLRVGLPLPNAVLHGRL